MSHIMGHTHVGFCWWDLPAFLVLIGVIIFFIVRHHKMKKQREELEDKLSELYADDAVNEADTVM